MPVYEYRCRVCNQRVAVLVRSGGAKPTCPECGGLLSDKLFSVPNLLSGRTPPPVPACCGQEERCDAASCSYGEDCRPN